MSLSQLIAFEPIAAIATTPNASQRLQPLCQTADVTLYVPQSLGNIPRTQVYPDSLRQLLPQLWSSHRAIVFCLALGAVVRLIAPLLQHKSTDPAIIVVDETGQFVISVCSGHIGGGDQLAQLVARILGATPILTGSANALNLPGIDVLGTPFGWKRGSGDWTGVSAAIAQQKTVQVQQEAGSTLWQHHLPATHSFEFTSTQTPQAQIWISPKQRQLSTEDLPQVQWHPRVLWVGVGCERNTPKAVIERAILEVLQAHQLAEEAVAGIATIDLKADETGLVELCQERHWPLQTFSAEILRQVTVPTPSEIVQSEVGTPSVAEAAALQAAQVQPLLVSKQIYRSHRPQPSEAERIGQAVTVAIAIAQQEYTGRDGQLLLVGIGPGQLNQMTPAAQTAVTQADVVIGYSLYLDLITPLLRSGQIVESYPITQERQRAERAIGLAQWGLTVAVVSSGDCGIYGMAGLVFEQLRAQGWQGETPRVQVFPGISALQAAASRVGAPLMHDFCAISLSDLLTPWEMIEKRLKAAAMADFVCALYNPRSRSRTEQLSQAQAIFLQFRSPQTPVALVRSAYRDDEHITLTTLEKLGEVSVDMLTTVLIGNQSTTFHHNWMITPRGYLGFT
ncbi:precorrin-3B C(17)-methyltransferase [Lyngbya sp. PCC 8106]|uniref:precorrin-3B C(17)-methyltransferase n=1 Tax=Lyngbya sp. (strain PCC 8106) TaxID=313612 RepID=UPI0000EAC9FE|nr:precorrin-3B C(17)-methyltransferase [Lyngbya sp. PCC 8106]EAW37973.1 precorrin methylase [Lyngbya sp. PCC 8106]